MKKLNALVNSLRPGDRGDTSTSSPATANKPGRSFRQFLAPLTGRKAKPSSDGNEGTWNRLLQEEASLRTELGTNFI